MNPSARLELDLTDWLRETAMPHTPDYTEEIIEETARVRQRPRWTFVGRWMPLPNVRPSFLAEGRRVLTAVTLLVVLALILAAVAAFVGSRRTVPAPFGLAGTGLMVVSDGGDIVVVDHTTRVARSIVAHDAVDRDPRWSPDGTRLSFIRESSNGQVVVITDATGQTIAISKPFADFDPDSLTWAPNGREIAIATQGEHPAIVLIDAATGASREIEVDYLMFEVFWRPPDGRQLLFRTGSAPGGLAIVSIADGSTVPVPTSGDDREDLRPLGWTPDGRSVLYQHNSTDAQSFVVDVATGAETRLAVGYGHISNGGTRVAGVNGAGQFCVVAINGGPCDVIESPVQVAGAHGASVSWSPDDRWIAISLSPVWLVDPMGVERPRIVADGGPATWQRLAS
jgi:Tol biopolymer transport system component